MSIPLLITKALKDLSNEFGEYGPIIEKIRLVEDMSEISDMWINPHCELGYNVKLCNKLNYAQLKAVVLHELRHIEHGHFQRKAVIQKIFGTEVSHLVHNIAMDLEINCKIPDIPQDSVFPKNYGFDDDLTYEEYFQKLMNHGRLQSILQRGNGRNDTDLDAINQNPGVWNQSSSNEILSQEDEKFLEDLEMEVKEATASIGKQKGHGKSKLIIKPAVPIDILSYLRSYCSNLRNEKTHGYDLINYSSLKSSTIPDVLEFNTYAEKITILMSFIVDVSGSRSNTQVNTSISRIMSTLDSIDNATFILDLYFADVGTTARHRIEKVEDLPSDYRGRGGTAMAPVFNDFKEDYDLVVILTDGYIDWGDINRLPRKWFTKTVIGIDKESYLATSSLTKLPTFVL